jgi:hypothetical protein
LSSKKRVKMIKRNSGKSAMASLRLRLFAPLVLALLMYEPPSRLVHGQLEAVGAVLSVVPVTSILATAGLVGVKLAALSRLLNILGYDRAYLAQNLGTGTAAAPIGLQTRYAYMFPYVPGLNISVKGDDSIGMPKEAVSELNEDGSKAGGAGGPPVGSGPPRRKTFPAIMLPGEYETQQKPFRGGDALKDVFNKVGLQVHIPTAAQQQQLQQKFNLLPQGKDRTTANNQHQNQNYRKPEHSNAPVNNPTTATANDNDPNRNDKQQLQPHLSQQQPTYKDPQLPTTNDKQQQPPPQIDGTHGRPASLLSDQSRHSVVPSNVAPIRASDHSQSAATVSQSLTSAAAVAAAGAATNTANAPTASAAGNQPASKPSSSSSHQKQQIQQPTSSSSSNPSPPGAGQAAAAAAGTATQVNMPHPHYNRHSSNQHQPPQVADLRDNRAPAGVLRGHLSNEEPEPPPSDDFRSPPRPSLASLHYGHHAVIPQRELFSLVARQRQWPPAGGLPVALNMGHLSRPSAVMPEPAQSSLLTPIQAVELIPSRTRPMANRPQHSAALPESFKPFRHPELANRHWPSHFRPTVASLGAGVSSLPNEMTTTNFFPRPFEFDEPPSFSGDRLNELDRLQPHHRRRKRSPAPAPPAPLPDPVLAPAGHGGAAPAQARHQPSTRHGPNFGMPVSNINTLRRRRRRRRQAWLFGLQ